MENTLLIGLSRQMMLERQIYVIANNVANVNTNGYKADRSLLEEYLMPGAHEDNFVGPDRRLTTAPPFTTSQAARPSRPRAHSMSPSTARRFWWCRRRTASATTATADCRSMHRDNW